MLERLVETFCEVDDFCKAFMPQWDPYLLGTGTAPCGPEPGLFASEIITILLMLHSSRCKYLKNFYQGVMGDVLRQYFPHIPYYERFVTIQKSVFMPLLCFLLSRLGQRTGIYYIDSTVLPNVIQYPKIWGDTFPTPLWTKRLTGWQVSVLHVSCTLMELDGASDDPLREVV